MSNGNGTAGNQVTPSGNLANTLVNDMGASASAAVNGISDFIGSLADLSGAVGAVTGIIGTD